MGRKHRIALMPYAPKMGSLETNSKEIKSRIHGLLDQHEIDLIVLPELALTGYVLENLTGYHYLQKEDQFIIDFAKLSKKADIIIGGIYLDNAKLYNSALVFQNGEFRDPHKKVYLPTYGMFDEARYFAAGEQLNHYQGKIGNFNILICEDAWHPILAYTAYSQKSLHSICISASPGRITMAGEDCSAFKNWLSRLKIYAESFSQFQYYVNLAGVEDGIYYNGETFVISPLGNEINALEKTNTYHIYEINTEDLVSAYQKGGPAQNENFTLNTHLVNQAFSRRSK